jgi:hypothetical protein
MTSVRQDLTVHIFHNKISILAQKCKEILGDEPSFADGLDALRALLKLFAEVTKQIKLTEKIQDSFTLNEETAQKTFPEYHVALKRMTDAETKYHDYQKNHVSRLESILDEKYSIAIKKISDEHQTQLKGLVDQQSRLAKKIDFLRKARMVERAEDRNIKNISVELQERMKELIAIREKKDKCEAAIQDKSDQVKNELKAQLVSESNVFASALYAAKESFEDCKKDMRDKIGMQKKIYESAITPAMMFACLRAYDCFCLIHDELQARAGTINKSADIKTENADLISTKILWKTPSQIIQEILVRINEDKEEIKRLFKMLWCPESGNKNGIKTHELYRKLSFDKQRLLYEENRTLNDINIIIPEAKDRAISLLDLNSKILPILPAALIENTRSPKNFDFWKEPLSAGTINPQMLHPSCSPSQSKLTKAL